MKMKWQKNKLEEDENENGYGDWLKSDEGIYSINENVTKTNMNEIFEKQKKRSKKEIWVKKRRNLRKKRMKTMKKRRFFAKILKTIKAVLIA